MPLNHNDHFVVNAATPARRQIIEFKLSEEVLEEILNGRESLQLDMGQSKFMVGTTSYDFSQMQDINNMELYRLPAGTKQLDLVGNITSKCTIQKIHVKKGQKKATRQEPVRVAQRLDPKDLKKGSKSTSAQIPVRHAQSPSPSAAAIAGTVVPLRTRVVQLLAWNSEGTEERAFVQLRAAQEELQSILSAVATYYGRRYYLKPETYKEVKIYDWKSYSAKQRDSAAKNASAAFDKLGLSPDAPERSILDPDQVKRSPPLVAEGIMLNNSESANSRGWRAGGGGGGGGGGSESEGLENGRSNHNTLLKPPGASSSSSQKKVSARKSPAATTSGTLTSKKKTVSSSSSSGTKASRQQAADKVVASILESVPNHSKSASTNNTPSMTTKSTLSGAPATLGVIGSPSIAGRRGSINSNTNGTAMARRGSETKRSSGNGTRDPNVYRIPKVGNGTTISRKPQTFTVAPITTQAEYQAVSQQFHSKYKEMKNLKVQIDKKKEEFDRLNGELELALGSDPDRSLKRRVEQAFGQEVPDRKILRRSGEPRSGISVEKAAAVMAEQNHHPSVRTMVERYKAVHHEVDTLKKALWEAGSAQSDKNGPGSANSETSPSSLYASGGGNG
ncbi:hypothetical protein BGZ83_005084 [Gryganskiella cystojenkinii]|nr:hypothetical protein BGZ83_005084 [Gryganskiella cystojenkinii]